MEPRAISTDRAPMVGFSSGTKSPLSQAVRYGDIVFCSGQGPLDPETREIVSSDFEEQTRQTLSNMLAVVEAAGSSKDRILKCTCHLRDVSTFPARTTTEGSPPREGVLVEVECIAAAAD